MNPFVRDRQEIKPLRYRPRHCQSAQEQIARGLVSRLRYAVPAALGGTGVPVPGFYGSNKFRETRHEPVHAEVKTHVQKRCANFIRITAEIRQSGEQISLL